MKHPHPTLAFCVLCWLLLTPPPTTAEEHQPPCAVAAPAPETEIPKQTALFTAHRNIHNFATGAGITVAVIDTGIHPHPRLPEVINGGDLITKTPDGALHDCDAHGTIVAGIIAAHDTGDGIIGIAPDVRLLSIKQTSAKLRSEDTTTNNGTLASLTTAINSAIDQGAQVINTSVLSCIPPTTTQPGTGIAVDTSDFNQAMHRAEATGVVVVSAAGNINDTCPAGSTVYPAHHETALGVAALADPYTKTDYTLTSPFPQVSAPGSVFVGLSNTENYLSHGVITSDEVISYEGTSFAAPVVTGLVALLRQRYPQANAAEIRGIIYASTDPSSGMVDASRTMRYLKDAPTTYQASSVHPEMPANSSDRQLRFIRSIYALVACATAIGMVAMLQNRVHHRIKRRNCP